MSSKLSCDKFQQICNEQKETKSQKYLRERNQKLLAKCFNIKVEKPLDVDIKSSNKQLDIKIEEPSVQLNNTEEQKEICENISPLPKATKVEILKNAPIKAATKGKGKSSKPSAKPSTKQSDIKNEKPAVHFNNTEDENETSENIPPSPNSTNVEILQNATIQAATKGKGKSSKPSAKPSTKQSDIKNEEPAVHFNNTEDENETSENIPPSPNSTNVEILQNATIQADTKSKEKLSKSSTKTTSPSKTKRILKKAKPKNPTGSQPTNKSNQVKSTKELKPTNPTSPRVWKSPFASFTTKGKRNRAQESSEFSYDLSQDELKFVGRFRNPMKPASEAERQLLDNGQRREYLMQRYEHSPVAKYNYPEATSWRIGWLHDQQ